MRHPSNVFDIAIIGAGSSGCALAGRLAARTDFRIALIEAGPGYGPRASGSWPADLVDAHGLPDSHEWGFEQSRARVVGGCSAHNECAIVRALPGDYDRWGIPGWKDADLASAVSEVWRKLPTRACRDEELAIWQRIFLESALQSGFRRFADANDVPGAPGVAPFAQNIKDGVRWNAAFAFLDPVRSRLTVIDRLLADRLVLQGDRAKFLVGRGHGGARDIYAERFVLSAGVYGSPAILLRSGIGPAEHLEELRIPVRIALPGVGSNLHDHPGVGLDYGPARHILRAVKKDLAAGRLYESQVVLKTPPDLHILPYQTGDGAGGWSFSILAYYLSPRSRGHVRLKGPDPDDPPMIELGLLNDPDDHDLAALIEGVRLIHRLTRQPPLARAIRRGPRRFTSDVRIARFVRTNVTDYGHSVGTCRMGPSPGDGDVVDPGARVHGLANVFVADASVMPQIPRANTNFTCFVLGARAADLIVDASG
jgi:choline dehydrogenase